MFERGKKDEPFAGSGSESSETRSKPEVTRTSDHEQRPGEGAVIGRSIKINGDLRGEEDLRIEGDVTGTVQLKNNSLVIGKEGKIKADIYAKSIIVDGQTEGDLYASERVNVRPNARVFGNITAPRVGIEDGAKFKGSIEMDKAAVDKALGTSGQRPNGSQGFEHSPKPVEKTLSTGTSAKESATN